MDILSHISDVFQKPFRVSKVTAQAYRLSGCGRHGNLVCNVKLGDNAWKIRISSSTEHHILYRYPDVMVDILQNWEDFEYEVHHYILNIHATIYETLYKKYYEDVR